MAHVFYECLILFFLVFGRVAYADEFPQVTRLSDFPLPPDMMIISQPSVSEELSQGTTQILVARGSLSENTILQFYRDTLPMSGWRSMTPHQFIRNWDQFEFTIDTIPGGRLLTLYLSPAPLRP